MSPRNHPSADILAAYAGGALEPGFGLVVGAHLDYCPGCRRKVGAFEASSGAALDALPPAALAADALERVMAKLDAPPEPAPRAERRTLLDRLPLKKKRWVIPGLWVAAVDTPHAPDNRVYLLGAAPGALTGQHTHGGAEFCTVLKGAFSDKTGHYTLGDFAAGDEDLDHQPKVEGDEECICLFATEGRLKAHGLLAQLAFRYADV